MPLRRFTVRQILLLGLLFVLGVSLFGVATMPDALEGLIIRRTRPATLPWRFIEPEEIVAGVSIPAKTQVIFHMPDEIPSEKNPGRITREILLGRKGWDVRYWGYCLPENFDPEIVRKRTGLPGLLFLSEAERKARKPEPTAPAAFDLFSLPSYEQQLNNENPRGDIRHQMEIFLPGMLCFLMTERELAMGLDVDGDTLNSRTEYDIGTDPENQDTDGDGIFDQIEHLHDTNPLLRDTDLDGILDGIEDANANGYIDPGETDPRNTDSDRDGLCDGNCTYFIGAGIYRQTGGQRRILAGEDTNLNGTVDENETDPRLYDTDNDGVSDEQAFFNCLLGLSEFCTE